MQGPLPLFDVPKDNIGVSCGMSPLWLPVPLAEADLADLPFRCRTAPAPPHPR